MLIIFLFILTRPFYRFLYISPKINKDFPNNLIYSRFTKLSPHQTHAFTCYLFFEYIYIQKDFSRKEPPIASRADKNR